MVPPPEGRTRETTAGYTPEQDPVSGAQCRSSWVVLGGPVLDARSGRTATDSSRPPARAPRVERPPDAVRSSTGPAGGPERVCSKAERVSSLSYKVTPTSASAGVPGGMPTSTLKGWPGMTQADGCANSENAATRAAPWVVGTGAAPAATDAPMSTDHMEAPSRASTAGPVDRANLNDTGQR